jgi:hypothetical protein
MVEVGEVVMAAGAAVRTEIGKATVGGMALSGTATAGTEMATSAAGTTPAYIGSKTVNG